MHVGKPTIAQSTEIHSFGVHLSTHPVLHPALLPESGIKDGGIRDHPGAREGFFFVSLVGKASVLSFRKLFTCPAQAQRKKSW